MVGPLVRQPLFRFPIRHPNLSNQSCFSLISLPLVVDGFSERYLIVSLFVNYMNFVYKLTMQPSAPVALYVRQQEAVNRKSLTVVIYKSHNPVNRNAAAQKFRAAPVIYSKSCRVNLPFHWPHQIFDLANQ